METIYQRQLEMARTALNEQHPEYTIYVCEHLLCRYPQNVSVRKLLRTAQKTTHKKRKGFFRTYLFSIAIRTYLCCTLRQNPLFVLAHTEKLLCINPDSSKTLKLQAKAAEVLQYWNLAVLAYQDIQTLRPKNLSNTLALARVLLQSHSPKKAYSLAMEILHRHPHHTQAKALLRQASVAQALEQLKLAKHD